MSAGAKPPREVLAKQLAMNRQSWPALAQHGVTDETKLRLEFFFVAPGEKQARALAELLQRETDYEMRAGSSGGGLMKRKNWTVTGARQGTKVSQAILDQWVTWMLTAGAESGCEFDGWGAEAPGP